MIDYCILSLYCSILIYAPVSLWPMLTVWYTYTVFILLPSIGHRMFVVSTTWQIVACIAVTRRLQFTWMKWE